MRIQLRDRGPNKGAVASYGSLRGLGSHRTITRETDFTRLVVPTSDGDSIEVQTFVTLFEGRLRFEVWQRLPGESSKLVTEWTVAVTTE